MAFREMAIEGIGFGRISNNCINNSIGNFKPLDLNGVIASLVGDSKKKRSYEQNASSEDWDTFSIGRIIY